MTDLNERLIEIEDTLERLRYEVDRPYRSARRYRVFSVILGVFLFGAISLGLIGTVRVLKEADRIQSLRQSIEEDFNTIVKIRTELKTANEMVLQEVWQSIPGVLHKVEEDLSDRLRGIKKEVADAISDMRLESDTELKEFSVRLQDELDALDIDIQQVRTIFRKMSHMFSEVEEANASLLTARERQLLTLLAREMDPENPELNYQSAEWAYDLGQYRRAQELAGLTVTLRGTNPDLAKQADDLARRAQDRGSNPQKLTHESPGRTRVGPYGIFALHYNTLIALVDHGYMTMEEAQKILEQSKRAILKTQ